MITMRTYIENIKKIYNFHFYSSSKLDDYYFGEIINLFNDKRLIKNIYIVE